MDGMNTMTINLMKMNSMTKTAPNAEATSSAKVYLAAAAIALSLIAYPHAGHAQGIVRGAQQGAYDGDRVAGPIGGLVGGAVGAGVGGAIGAVDGIFGIPYGQHYRCRGYYGRSGRFHCYR
jgi:hypothetical protein